MRSDKHLWKLPSNTILNFEPVTGNPIVLGSSGYSLQIRHDIPNNSMIRSTPLPCYQTTQLRRSPWGTPDIAKKFIDRKSWFFRWGILKVDKHIFSLYQPRKQCYLTYRFLGELCKRSKIL